MATCNSSSSSSCIMTAAGSTFDNISSRPNSMCHEYVEAAAEPMCLDEAGQASKEQGQAGRESQAQGAKGSRDTANGVQGGGHKGPRAFHAFTCSSP